VEDTVPLSVFSFGFEGRIRTLSPITINFLNVLSEVSRIWLNLFLDSKFQKTWLFNKILFWISDTYPQLQFILSKTSNMSSQSKHKILLCEDDANLGLVLKNFLELNEFEVVLERDGRLGLAAFQREKFDICLLDVMMPKMDGFALAEEIRDINPDIPLFFLSAKSMKEDQIKGYKLGAV